MYDLKAIIVRNNKKPNVCFSLAQQRTHMFADGRRMNVVTEFAEAKPMELIATRERYKTAGPSLDPLPV
ncbi:MAG TPA: hypothetical protein DDZ51_09475 [Planctomycetaceae bacterium]|nr:hypothetical protein [Planctomycetaceae bacterium]